MSQQVTDTGTAGPYAIVTGEAVSLDIRVARLGSRMVAYLLDVLLEIVVLVGVLIALAATRVQFDSALVTALGLTLFVLVFVGYPTAAETLSGGRTLGKAAMGLRVVRDDGGRAGFVAILARELIGLIVERPGLFLFVPAVITSMASERGKRIGDLVAGTIVVQERVPDHGGAVAVMPPALAGWAAGLDLSGLPDDLALTAREFLARSPDMDPRAREHLGGQLVAGVAATVGPPPPGVPGWAYLTAVLAERRRREELRSGGGSAAPRSGRPPSPAATPAPPPPISPTPPAEPTSGGFAPPG